MTSELKARVDKATRELFEKQPGRRHLGASVMGNKCARQLWYGFRGAHVVRHTGRMNRLFDRGHEEEFRIVRWLRAAGFTVRDYAERLLYHPESDSYYTCDWDVDWSQGEGVSSVDVSDSRAHIQIALERNPQLLRQWHFTDHNGHFAGSSDAKLLMPDGVEWGLGEFKTHNDKSFKALESKGLMSSKLTHYVQMQIYMHYHKLTWGLYVAVNKNDDDMYYEVVEYKSHLAQQYVDKARRIIESHKPPKRYSEDKSWFECRFCDFRDQCHYEEPLQLGCRSCAYASPGPDASWYCGKYKDNISTDFIPVGCKDWSPIA